MYAFPLYTSKCFLTWDQSIYQRNRCGQMVVGTRHCELWTSLSHKLRTPSRLESLLPIRFGVNRLRSAFCGLLRCSNLCKHLIFYRSVFSFHWNRCHNGLRPKFTFLKDSRLGRQLLFDLHMIYVLTISPDHYYTQNFWLDHKLTSNLFCLSKFLLETSTTKSST